MNNIKNNKFFSLFFLLLSFLILLFFTKDVFLELQENIDLKKKLTAELEESSKTLSELNTLKAELSKEQGWDIKQYLSPFIEDKITEYIYTYVNNSPELNISQLSINPGKINEYGFIEGSIILDVRVLDENALINFIDFLLKEDSEYKFFIEALSYSYQPWSFNISIPLTVFYK